MCFISSSLGEKNLLCLRCFTYRSILLNLKILYWQAKVKVSLQSLHCGNSVFTFNSISSLYFNFNVEKYSVRSEVQVTKFLILCKKGLLKTFLL